MVADVEHDAVAGELAAYQREESLAKELGRVKAENAELLTKVQKVTASLKNAKVTAREALIEMADQNAKLVQAFVDKKRECKQLKASAREDRKIWQQRLQTVERELEHNKQHIQQLMQQLHAIAAKQAASPEPSLDVHVTSAMLRHPPGQLNSSPTGSTHSSSSSASCNSSSMHGEVFHEVLQPPQQPETASILQQQSPLGDATNRFSNGSNRHQQNSSSTMVASSASSKLKAAASRAPAAGDENSCPSRQQQHSIPSHPAACSRGGSPGDPKQEQAGLQELQTQHDQQQRDLQQQRQQQPGSGQLIDAQRQVEALQQRAQQLEAENAQLKTAQAVAAAQIDNLRLRQQAEELKQRGNRHFQAQEYQQAAAAYTRALGLGIPDASLSAVLLCNRAASQHAAGQYLEAIADCCAAHKLDAKYPRVLQRRAEAYMAIQHYNAAVADLQVLLEQSEAGSSKEVAARLASAQAKQRNHGTLGPNHYVILGLEAGATAADVKAAYKRLALRHHPDKASSPEAKAAAESVFVLITAANSVLSDPIKRSAYDVAYTRSRLLYGGQSSSQARGSSNTSSASSSHRHSSSTGMGTAWWQQTTASSTYAAATHAAAAAAARASAAASAAAAPGVSRQYAAPGWQQGAFRAGGPAATPADSCNTANSSSSCASGASFAHGMRL